jgi:methyl-accepting chemotaxis protein
MNVRLVTRPFRPELNGTDVSGIKDLDGNAVFVRFVETVQRDGSGFLSYLWPKPGQDRTVEKVPFVTGFKPWRWVIGSRLYVEDLRAEFLASSGKAAAVIAAAIGFVTLMALTTSRSITLPLDRALKVVRGGSNLKPY